MTTEEALKILDTIPTISEQVDALEMAIKALEQQPCEDAISRESVIKWLKDKDIIKMKNQEENARRELAELPSVTPARPTARWERFAGDYNKCSKCGKLAKFYFNYEYCPGCGAKMQEVEE